MIWIWNCRKSSKCISKLFTGSCSAGSCDYFTGGYITQQYGSRDGGLTDAMQLETRL